MSRDADLHKKAAQFFQVFSRMEYALKASGYNYGDGTAKANWDRFALAVASSVNSPPSGEVGEAIAFLLDEPPKKQIIASGVLEWRVSPANTGNKADDLFVYIRRVRNNLFHGGKFNDHWFAPERSEKLMAASLAVMFWAIELDLNVQAAYHG
jgi:hypothetical protein